MGNVQYDVVLSMLFLYLLSKTLNLTSTAWLGEVCGLSRHYFWKSRNSPVLELRKCPKLFKNSLGLTKLIKSYNRNVLKWTRGKCDWVANIGVFRMLHKFLLLAAWDCLTKTKFSVSKVRANGVYYTWFMKWWLWDAHQSALISMSTSTLSTSSLTLC